MQSISKLFPVVVITRSDVFVIDLYLCLIFQYMASPSHIEMILSEKTAPIAKGEEDETTKKPKISKKRLAQIKSKEAIVAK